MEITPKVFEEMIDRLEKGSGQQVSHIHRSMKHILYLLYCVYYAYSRYFRLPDDEECVITFKFLSSLGGGVKRCQGSAEGRR